MASCRGLVATASPKATQSFLSIVSGTTDALGAGQRHGWRGVAGRLPSAQDKERSHVKACPHRRRVRRGLPVVLHRKGWLEQALAMKPGIRSRCIFGPISSTNGSLSRECPASNISPPNSARLKLCKDIAQRVMAAAAGRRADLCRRRIDRQPNTRDAIA